MQNNNLDKSKPKLSASEFVDKKSNFFELNKVDLGTGSQALPGRIGQKIGAGLREFISVPIFFVGLIGFVLLGFAMICFDFLTGEHKKIKRIDIHT